MKQAGVTADSSYLSLHPILIWCTSSHLFEQPAQVMRILESHFVGNFADGLVRFQQAVFHPADDSEMNVFDSRLARLFLYKVTKVIGGEVKLVGTPGKAQVLPV